MLVVRRVPVPIVRHVEHATLDERGVVIGQCQTVSRVVVNGELEGIVAHVCLTIVVVGTSAFAISICRQKTFSCLNCSTSAFELCVSFTVGCATPVACNPHARTTMNATTTRPDREERRVDDNRK